MSLTRQNMETTNRTLGTELFRDIARMDRRQLDKYVRRAFNGDKDASFLPLPFWETWYDVKLPGPSLNGIPSSTPSRFFSGTHDLIGAIARGVRRVGQVGEEQPDFEYRVRYRDVLFSILVDCSQEESPGKKEKRMAGFAVEAVWLLRSTELFNRDYPRMTVGNGGKEGTPTFLEDSAELSSDLEVVEREKAEMMEMVDSLIGDDRFKLSGFRELFKTNPHPLYFN